MVNFSALNNLTPINISTDLINQANETIPNIIENANTTSDGYLGLLVLLTIFVFMTYILFKDDGFFRLDFVRSLVFSSGIALFIGVIMIVSRLITNYQHVVWFAILFSIAVISSYYLKKKGL